MNTTSQNVLILIFLENALRLNDGYCYHSDTSVLILIFLENALRHNVTNLAWGWDYCLNPYFFGKCSTAFSYCGLCVLSIKS